MTKLTLNQPALKPLLKVDLTGRVVIVTGANTGLGFEACKHIAKMNPAKLIMGSRDLGRGTEALKQLQADTGFANAEVGQLDQASFESIRTFASKFLQENDRLDLVLENAAVALERYQVSADDWEEMLQVNVIGPAYLTFLLLPIVRRTAAKYTATVPRITIVSSGAHGITSFDEEALGALDSESLLKKINEPEYSQRIFPDIIGDSLGGSKTMMERRYPDVKLMNILFARELLARVAKSDIEVNNADPGFCFSNLRRHVTGLRAKAMDEVADSTYTSEEGGRNLTYALLFGKGQEINGKFISCMQFIDTSEFSNSETGKKVGKALWNELVHILNEVDPNVKEIVDTLN